MITHTLISAQEHFGNGGQSIGVLVKVRFDDGVNTDEIIGWVFPLSSSDLDLKTSAELWAASMDSVFEKKFLPKPQAITRDVSSIVLDSPNPIPDVQPE